MQVMGIDIGGSSVKLALLEREHVLWTGQSGSYARPDATQLIEAMRTAARGKPVAAAAVGICVPGLLDRDSRTVTYSVNLPELAGTRLDDLVRRAWPEVAGPLHVINDALAAAVDVAVAGNLRGRILVLSLGTGVGAGLLDDGTPVTLEGDSPGHIGQMDVSLDSNPPIGPDGGAGSLESYLGTPALIRRFGSMERFFEEVRVTDPPMLALVRAIRICHAIYRPDHLVLAGGVGIRLKHLIHDLKKQVNQNLTQVAKADWSLGSGEHDFHAAIGAARLAQL